MNNNDTILCPMDCVHLAKGGYMPPKCCLDPSEILLREHAFNVPVKP